MANKFTDKRKYRFIDFLTIPLMICPLYTAIKILNQILGALLPSLQVLVTAKFIDTALLIFNQNSPREAIYLPLIWLMLIVAYRGLNWQLYKS